MDIFRDLPVTFAGIDKVFEVTNYIDLGFTTIRWYGAIIAFGFTLAVLFGGRTAYVWKINLDKMTVDELEAYAKENNISLDGCSNKAEKLAKIKESIKE